MKSDDKREGPTLAARRDDVADRVVGAFSPGAVVEIEDDTLEVYAPNPISKLSELLRHFREGRGIVVTTHGIPIARIVSIGARGEMAAGAPRALFARLQVEPVDEVGAVHAPGAVSAGLREGGVRVALDATILASAEGAYGGARKAAAGELIQKLPRESIVLPAQTLGELFQRLVQDAGRSPADGQAAISSWRDAFAVIDTSAAIMIAAIDLTTTRSCNIWEAVILSTAAGAGCRLLLSENFEEGFSWKGVTVTNPFSVPRHTLLELLLNAEAL